MDNLFAEDPEAFYQLDAEAICLMGILVEIGERRPPMAILNFLKPTDFYDPRHAMLFEHIQKIMESGELPTGDLVFFRILERTKNDEERHLMANLLTNFLQSYPTALGTNSEAMAKKVKFYAMKRELYIKLADKRRLPADKELFEQLERDFYKIKTQLLDIEVKGNTSVKEILQDDAENIPVVKCEYPRLQALIDDFRPAQVYIIAGNTGIGKTTFVLNIVADAALKQEVPTLMISSEIDRRALVDRVGCMYSGVDYDKYRRKYLSKEEMERFNLGFSLMHETPLYISDDAFTIEQCEQLILHHTDKYGVRLVVIDFIQHLSSRHRKRWNNRDEELTYIIRTLKLLSVKSGVAMIVVSQLSRKPSSGKKPRPPKLSDLRESGSLEQNADVVLLLHRVEDNVNKVIVAKNRWGKTGEIPFFFNFSTGRIGETTYEYEYEENDNEDDWWHD